MRRRSVLLVTSAVLVVACGSNRDGDDGEATLPTQPQVTEREGTTGPAETTSAPNEPRPAVGTVLEVVTPGGDVDGRTAESGDPIPRAAVVTTEAAGKIHFSVDDKIEACILRAQGQAIVVPGDGPLVQLVRGEATCRTRPGGGAVEIQAGGVQVVVSDPVFRLAVDEEGGLTAVGVAQGAVSVDGELLVGGQEATWADGSLGDRQSVEFDDDLAILGQSLPPVVYGTPAAGSSATWDAARDAGVLPVVVVQPPEDTPAGDLTAALLQPFGNVLGAQVAVNQTDASPEEVAETLGGRVGVMVTASPVDGLPSVLLFEAGGTPWFAQAQPGDDGFAGALRDYLAGILQGPCPDGPGEVAVQAGEQVCYVTRYEAAFRRGDQPPPVPLDQFAGLLGL